MRAAIVAIFLAVSAGSGHAQVLAEIDGVVVSSVTSENSSLACSKAEGTMITFLVIGYMKGYEQGVISGAANMQFVLTKNMDFEAADRAIDLSELPDLTYGAYASQVQNFCNRYPTADVRDVVAAAASKINTTMRLGD
jgi:hypothetical protein